MVGILTLYIKNQLAQGAAHASEISHLFKFGVYFMPLFGAWLSDRILGRYWIDPLHLALLLRGPRAAVACGPRLSPHPATHRSGGVTGGVEGP